MPCLTKDISKRFLEAIRSGEISPEKLIGVTSKERQAILGQIVGEENVPWVNAALESKILLKDQSRGMVSWAKKVSGISEPVRRDMLSRIQRENRVFDPETSQSFLESLAAKKFGQEITFEEAKNVSELANRVRADQGKIKESDADGSASRMRYGETLDAFREYIGNLKLTAGKVPASWYLKHPLQSIYRFSGVAKSLLSTLDNSFYGRQGIKVLYTHPDIWAKDFVKSWGRIGNELAGRDAMSALRAYAYSTKNALNGKYKAMGLDIGLASEEAFPSHVLTKIPVFGRVAAAAESAFNGGALMMRVKIADRMIANAERTGVNMLDATQAEPIGRIVNAMTGRGNIGKLDVYGKEINSLIFSVKFLKSNFDTLTAHQFQKGITPHARKLAAMNMVKILGSLTATYTLANMLSPGSVELDPRSTRFGKIKVGNTTFDPTGGMSSLATLAARMVPTVHNGKMGFYTKTRDGEVRELGTGKFGSKSPLDVAFDFTEGKFAPYPALLRDLWRGEDFQQQKTYIEGHRAIPTPRTVLRAHVPIPLQNFEQTMADPNANVLLNTIMDGLGFSTTTTVPEPKPIKPMRR